jgi:flavin-dependent dehydrogenase
VGEAAGLVNPLTGEGIDYALESAQIAAEHAGRMLSMNDRGGEEHTEYERLLHSRFGRLFGFCRRLRDATVHTALLNQLVRVAARRDDLKMRLIDVVLGAREIPAQLSTRTVLRKAYSLIR